MSELDEIASKAGSAAEFAKLYTGHLAGVVTRLDFREVGRVIDLFLQARSRGSTIFFFGNGGSAATAAHFANDLGFCASPEGRRPFRALSLSSNTSFITCLANDIGFDNVFSWQLRNHMAAGDVVVAV